MIYRYYFVDPPWPVLTDNTRDSLTHTFIYNILISWKNKIHIHFGIIFLYSIGNRNLYIKFTYKIYDFFLHFLISKIEVDDLLIPYAD